MNDPTNIVIVVIVTLLLAICGAFSPHDEEK